MRSRDYFSTFIAVLSGTIALTALTGLTPASALAQSEVAQDQMNVKAVNRPLHSLREAADRARFNARKPGPPREVPNYRRDGRPLAENQTNLPDAILQESAGILAATSLGSGFPGTSNHANGDLFNFLIAPPDTDGQVGPNHFVQMINLVTTVFDKAGNVVMQPVGSNVFWAGIGGNCEAYNQGDPITLYDEQTDRWVVSQFAFDDNTTTYSQCVAVSMTGDPTGGYHRYEFNFDSIGFPDYPKHGIVTDSITLMANLFTKRGRRLSWGGTFLAVLDKNAMYAGQTAGMIGQNIGAAEFGFVAGDLDGEGTAPALFATAMTTANQFDIWQADVDWDTEAFSLDRIAAIPVTPFDTDLCDASREACIPQPNNGPALEALSDRLMHRLQLRDFGSYRTMVTAHAVDVGGGRAGVRWYEFREEGGPWYLYQEGTYGPDDGENRWVPSAAMNAAGDIGVGYLIASESTYVSTAASGQSAAASGSGVFDADELVCAPGSGVQEQVNRAGDYSSTSVDPIDDSFWHTNEVFVETAPYQWATYICEFAVSDGEPVNVAPTASFTYDCTDLDCSFDGSGSSDTDGTIESYAWDFGDGNSASGVTAIHSYEADGEYTVTLTVTDDGSKTGNDSQTFSVSGPVVNDPPAASFTSSCTDLTCTFTDTSIDDGPLTWNWDFGDGGTSTDQNPVYTYGATGTYTVTLTVDDGEYTDAATGTVNPQEPANVSPTATFTFDCTDKTCDFDGSGSSDSDGTIASYAWDFGDGASGSGATASHSYAAYGSYGVTLTVTDDDGATGTDTQTVTVTEPVTIDVDLVPSADISRNKWTAIVTEGNGNDLAGTWSVDGTASCSSNVCTLSNLHVRKVLSVTFTESITGNGETIVVNQND